MIKPVILSSTAAQLGHGERTFHYDYYQVNDVVVTSLIRAEARYAANLNKFGHIRVILVPGDKLGAVSVVQRNGGNSRA